MSPLTRGVGLPVLDGIDEEFSNSFSREDILLSSLGLFTCPNSSLALSRWPFRFSSFDAEVLLP